MNEDVFNTSIRKFLKTLGVTAQREIEKAVRQALAEGKLKYRESIVEGIDNAPQGFIALLSGGNFGKQLVRLA